MTPEPRPPDVLAAIVEAARRGAEDRRAAGDGRALERAAAAREPRGDLFRARTIRGVLARQHHVRLEQRAFQVHAL